jgi:RNA polymerase sigma-70 factor (sigma-E family)
VRADQAQDTATALDPAGGCTRLDVEEFSDYVRARASALLRTAYLITGSTADAEDLLQSTLAKVYLAWPRIRDKGAVDSYVRRTMVNTHTSRWRLRRVHEYPSDILPEPVSEDERFGQHDLHDAIWSALARLSKRQRATVILRYYLDLSEAEAAATLGVSVGTVKSTLHRALAKLREDATLRDDASLPGDPPTAGAPPPRVPPRVPPRGLPRLAVAS